MEQYTYLAHYGTKGMKWGERKYQNSDGSLTPLGRVHYGVGAALGSAKEAVRKKIAPTNAELNAQIRKQRSKNLNKEKRKELKSLKKGVDPKKKEEAKASGTHKKFVEMNDKEIQDQINRLQKEIQLDELQFRTSLSPGKRFIYDVGRDALKQGLTELGKSVISSKGKKLFGVSDGDKKDNNQNNNQDKKANNDSKKKDSPSANTVRYRREMEELKAKDALDKYKQEQKEKKGKEREASMRRRAVYAGKKKD